MSKLLNLNKLINANKNNSAKFESDGGLRIFLK